MSEIAFKSATQLAAMIQSKEISALELLEHYLDRIERFNSDLNAVIVLDTDRARIRAKEADVALANGEIWGPLHGVPMTIKESYNVAGLPTTNGRPEMKDNLAETDALSVERLKAAGVVIFGKTNVPLNLADFQTYNEVYGTTNNPWDLNCGPGGSSGGSAAALAAGLCGFEAGSDIGGSIRNPAHFSGVFGHKPTWGLIPPRGHALPGFLVQPDLSVVGPLARSAADLEAGVVAMAGPDELDGVGLKVDLPRPRHLKLGDYKVALWVNDGIAPVSKEIQDRVVAVGRTITAAGGRVDYGARPNFDAVEAHDIFRTLLWSTMAARTPDADFEKLLDAAGKLSPDDQSGGAQMLRIQTITYHDHYTAHNKRMHLRWAWDTFFEDYDALIAPIMATPAFEHDHSAMAKRKITIDGDERPYWEQLFWAGLAVCCYLPSTVIPTGPNEEGLPIGVQIIGRQYGDLETIGLSKLLEAEGYAFTPPPGYS
ncbi:MAG: amidase [Rickettsiales bacterium]|jgi:amidase|nr:amidase [Rickettsiales bacterium]|tara:strand:- start:756 stop:2207 length:1452 start_codon:yes stop_codon:yes gene_type:complete